MFLKKERRLSISSSLFYFLTFLPFLNNINSKIDVKYNNEYYYVYLIDNKYIISFQQNFDIEKENFFIFYYYSYPYFFEKNYSTIKDIIKKNINNNKLNLTDEYKQKIKQLLNSNSLYNKSLLLQISMNLYSNMKNNNIKFYNENEYKKIYKHINNQFKNSQLFMKNYELFIRQNFILTKNSLKERIILKKIKKIEKQNIPILKKYLSLHPLIANYLYSKQMIFYNSMEYNLFSLLKLDQYQNSFISKINYKVNKEYDYPLALHLYNYFIKFNKNILIQIIFVLFLFIASIIILKTAKHKYLKYIAIILLIIDFILIIIIRNNTISFISLINKKLETPRKFIIKKTTTLKTDENKKITHQRANKNILILGIGGSSHKDRKTNIPLGPYLTDVIIIANIIPDDSIVNLISIPRDLYIKNQKINSIYKKEGIKTLKQYLNQITGIKISNYFIIDFIEFKELIDIIGGITINLNKTFSDYDWLYLQKGTNHLYGDNCLKYIRSRRTTSDFSRSKRQHLIIKKIIAKLKNKEFIIKNFFPLLDIYKKTITDLNISDLWDLYNISNRIKYINSIILSTKNCLISEYDEELGYILYPKNYRYDAIKNYINQKTKIHPRP